MPATRGGGRPLGATVLEILSRHEQHLARVGDRVEALVMALDEHFRVMAPDIFPPFHQRFQSCVAAMAKRREFVMERSDNPQVTLPSLIDDVHGWNNTHGLPPVLGQMFRVEWLVSLLRNDAEIPTERKREFMLELGFDPEYVGSVLGESPAGIIVSPS